MDRSDFSMEQFFLSRPIALSQNSYTLYHVLV